MGNQFTLGATTQATLVYIIFGIFTMVPVWVKVHQGQDLKVLFLEQIKVGPLHSLYVHGSSTFKSVMLLGT